MSRTRGEFYEQQAGEYLQGYGLILVEKNYQVKCGEIDLIMQEGNTLVFIEVKARKNKRFGGALESITRQKIDKLRRAADYYLLVNKKYDKMRCRFDVVCIDISAKGDDEFSWLRDAF